jgi:peptidoglycan/LPS O-acetylase OafA/YrhL
VLAAGGYVANYRFALQRTDYLGADAPPSPVQHYWSLGVEEQFYLLWPALPALAALGLRRRARPSRARAVTALGLIGAGSLVLSPHLTRASQPWAFFSLSTRAWELAAGGLVALAAPARAPVVTAMQARLDELAGGAAPSGGAPDAPAAEAPPAAAEGSPVSAATTGPPVNPPSHGNPTNPAQPRSNG